VIPILIVCKLRTFFFNFSTHILPLCHIEVSNRGHPQSQACKVSKDASKNLFRLFSFAIGPSEALCTDNFHDYALTDFESVQFPSFPIIIISISLSVRVSAAVKPFPFPLSFIFLRFFLVHDLTLAPS